MLNALFNLITMTRKMKQIPMVVIQFLDKNIIYKTCIKITLITYVGNSAFMESV